MDERNYKAISFRLNLDDELDCKLYSQIMEEAERHTSISALSKDIFSMYFKQEEQKEFLSEMREFERQLSEEVCKIIREEMQEQSMKLVGALVAGLGSGLSGAGTIEQHKDIALPSSDENLPEELVGVLDFIG